MCDYFKSIPVELTIEIFGLLTSKCRSTLCTVSTYINAQSVHSSKKCSRFPKLFDAKPKRELTKPECLSLLRGGEYHLIVRLNLKRFIDLFCWNKHLFLDLCEAGYADIIELFFIVLGEDKGEFSFKWNRGLKNACKAGHMDVVKIIEERSCIKLNWNSCFIAACKGGHTRIAKMIIEEHVISKTTLMRALHNACSQNHPGVSEFVISMKPSEYCSNCGKSIKEHY
jgi:hypothetical protein